MRIATILQWDGLTKVIYIRTRRRSKPWRKISSMTLGVTANLPTRGLTCGDCLNAYMQQKLRKPSGKKEVRYHQEYGRSKKRITNKKTE